MLSQSRYVPARLFPDTLTNSEQVSNVGCALLGFWAGSLCLIRFINLVLWRNTSENFAPMWCEICSYFCVSRRVCISHGFFLRCIIATRITWIGRLGVITAVLTIARRSALVVSAAAHGQSFSESIVTNKKRVILVDLSTGLVLPILQLLICRFCLYFFYERFTTRKFISFRTTVLTFSKMLVAMIPLRTRSPSSSCTPHGLFRLD